MADFRFSRRQLMASLPAAILPSSLSAGGNHAAPRDKPFVDLARAAQRLQTTATVMMVGAHPDDERSGLLAAIRYLYGAQVVVVLATRGDGGQNAIGSEKGLALGALRTREMEEAARVLDASVEWLADGPEDAFADFGYSRSKEDTLERWGGRPLLVARLAEAIRRHRPDIIIGAFPDVDGQHAHHRAVVSAAEDAILLAASKAADTAGLAPWNVSFHFAPVPLAEQLAGDIAIDAGAIDSVSGLSFAAIGELSRIQHRSQNQGIPNPTPPSTWLLRTVNGREAPDDLGSVIARFAFGGLSDALPSRLARRMREAQALVDLLPSELGDFNRSIATGVKLGRILQSIERLSEEQGQARLLHRAAKARRQLDALLHLLSASARFRLGKNTLVQGETTSFTLASAMPTRIRLGTLQLAPGLRAQQIGAATGIIHVDHNARATSAFPRRFDPLGGNGPVYAAVDFSAGGYVARRTVDPERQTSVIPALSVGFDRAALLFNLAAAGGAKAMKLRDSNVEPDQLGIRTTNGWRVEPGDGAASFKVHPPASPGSATLEALIGGEPAQTVRRIDYSHIGTWHLVTAARLPMRAVDVALPAGAKVCCLTKDGNLGVWLHELGLAVGQFESPPSLAGFTTVIAASDAFTDDVTFSAALIDWVALGGHLVICAQRRTRDGSLGIQLPINLEIGRPRNAYRVSRPDAPVRVLAPEHPLLASPNQIDEADWRGWVQERAVGIASSWDPSFKPLIETSDAGQAPSKGALLSAPYRNGQITYIALALEWQLDALVPGALRFAANLAQSAKIKSQD